VSGVQNDQPLQFWIIGFGNSQRRDDGIGLWVIDNLKRRMEDIEWIKLVALHQLGPELAEDISVANGVIFVDAAIAPQPGGYSCVALAPVAQAHLFAHGLTPASLLGLAQLLYDRSPPAWMVSVEGSDFDFGEGLSAAALDHAARATQEVIRFISQLVPSKAIPA
jgi:hydrogenase maturation protease